MVHLSPVVSEMVARIAHTHIRDYLKLHDESILS
jgi:hypothetical protein